MVGKRTFHNRADDRWRSSDLESGHQQRRFAGFKDAVEYAMDRQTTAALKEQLRTGVDRREFEKYRKSEEEIKKIKDKKVRKFYEKQNAALNDWAEVDTIVLAMADEVLESMNTDADHDGIREREGRLQHVEEHIDALLPEDVRTARAKADRNARWAVNINVIANVVLLVAKGIAALKSSSLSLIASLLDSALDLLCTVIVWTTTRLVSWRLSSLRRKFPVGRRRLEPIGILVFSIIMVISFLQILQDSVSKLLPSGDHSIATLPALAIASMAGTVGIKGLIGLGCLRIKTTQVQALVQDCKTDVYFNTLSLLFPLIGKHAGVWWLDPLGAALLSLYIIYDWADTCLENVTRLCGLAVDDALQKKLIYLAYRFSSVVSGFKSVTAYHAGDGVWAEFDILLDEKTPLRRTHDIAETLQYCCEALTEVDRAFVTTDCDERKPTCRRCEAANVECAGYEQRRQIDPRPPGVTDDSTAPSSASSGFIVREVDTVSIQYPKIRTDGRPLIALPTNPRPDQRPHARARDVLAYHQFLFRTLPLLFPAEHLSFWRDRLCEEAWEAEYIFLTIAALGGVHRAVLLMSTPSKLEISRGLDAKVIAMQTYTEALQQISELSQPQAENSLDVFAGTFVLLAYFECLFGNIPAAVGHTNDAAHYCLLMRSDESQRWDPFVPAIESALRNLSTVCHVILPLPNLGIMDTLGQRLPAYQGLDVLGSSSTRPIPSTTSSGLQWLLDFADMHPDVKNLIWDPLTMHERTVLPGRITAFQEQLSSWTMANSHIFSQFDAQMLGDPNMEWSCDDVDMLSIPPRPYTDVPSHLCVLAALHGFYMARTLWALSLLGGHHDDERHYLAAYRHTYGVMRLVATIISNGEGVNDKGEGYLACETLGIGLLPIMHSLGQCCPSPTWLRWIMEQSSRLGQEGLFNGEIFAKNLNALYTFEMFSNFDSSSMLQHFPPPSSRVISVLLPAQDGQSYMGFYAGPESPEHRQGDAMPRYHPLGHARWSNVRRGGTTKPDIEIYDEQRKLAQPFTRIWLLEQEVSITWTAWSANVGFSLDRALRDHISGSCLENAVYEQDVP